MIRRIVLVEFQLFFPVRIDLHLQLQLQVHKKNHRKKYPDFDPSSLATISTWEALLCRIDLEPQKFSARTGLIYEIRIVLWAYKQYVWRGQIK